VQRTQAQNGQPRPVMEALDEAMTVLFALTQFHDVGFNLFLKFSEGQLTFEEEQMLNALGVKDLILALASTPSSFTQSF
jgi:hypothetical protein